MSSLVSATIMAILAVPATTWTQASVGSNPSQEQNQVEAQNPGTTAVVPEQLRRIEPPSPNASAGELEATGDQLREEKAYADAVDYYQAAIQRNDSAVLHDKAGIAELLMMRLDRAKKEFERATKMDKDYAEAYNNLGVVAYEQHKTGRAIKFYKKAIKIRETSGSFHSNLGTAYFGRKDYDKAMSEYARALQLDPDIFERRSQGGVSAQLVSGEEIGRYDFVIAKMYASAGNSDRCLLYLRKAMEEGYSGISDVYKQREFTKILKDPRFVSLMAAKPVPLPN